MSSAFEPLAPPAGRPGHKKTKSASNILRSIITPRNHARYPSEADALVSPVNIAPGMAYDPFSMPMLPPDHPANRQSRALGELQNHNSPASPTKGSPSKQDREEKRPGLIKKTKSAVSLRSLGKEKAEKKSKDETEQREPRSPTKKPKKTKSSTNLAGLLSRAKSREPSPTKRPAKDQENTTPPQSAAAVPPVHTPIWAQFATQQLQEVTSTTKVPLNDAKRSDSTRTFEDEIALYTPENYSPSKQRNFHGPYQPTLVTRQPLPRPKSAQIVNTLGNNILDSVTRRVSNERPDPTKRHTVYMGGQLDVTQQSRKSSWEKVIGRKSFDEQRKTSVEQVRPALGGAKTSNRVMAAVAAINGKAKSREVEKEVVLDPREIDAKFEAVLDSRNIPADLRPKMRALTTRVKADFIKSHQVEAPSSTSSKGSTDLSSQTQTMSKREMAEQSRKSSDGSREMGNNVLQEGLNSANATTKRERTRSKTFTFSRKDKGDKDNSASSNKRKHERTASSKSIVIPKSPSSTSLVSPDVQKPGFFSRAPKAAIPEEFVTYLRKEQKVEEVEVGRIQKLRRLLRNETVAWVDAFIQQGGMTEIVNLLHRIMAVEWREEHEDQLLHEALLCLKGLCTTDLAAQKLSEIASTLFPALLAMIFDEEHKGPSEFTTRQIIINLLFAYLSAASPTDLSNRARTVLSFLSNPTKPEDARPHDFLLVAHQARPYTTWCREVTNVTKEVFWIFLHHLNVIPLPAGVTPSTPEDISVATPRESCATDEVSILLEHEETGSYAKRHYPRPRPPVPAAPYVGGVEWDATNYLSSHLDLLNGLLAALPSKADRNVLRNELKVSGFEKAMGGTLRTCKEKFYGSVHDGLRTWVAAAVEDGWAVADVRMGEKELPRSPKKSPVKKKGDEAPKLEAPKMVIEKLSLGLSGPPGGSPVKETSQIPDYWV